LTKKQLKSNKKTLEDMTEVPPLETLMLLKEIGHGQFGKVYLIQEKENGKIMAVKQI